MVRGIPQLKTRLRKFPEKLEVELRRYLSRVASQVVYEMRSLKPLAEIHIAWTWGDPPTGSLSLGRVSRSRDDDIYITIYTTAFTKDYPAGLGFPAVSRWHEFGTGERFTKSGASRGKIVARPYFFPTFRANRTRIRSGVTRTIRKVARNS